MKKPVAIIFNDVHLKTGNEEEVYNSTVHLVDYAVKNNIKDLLFAGDLFDSRSFQRQLVLRTFDKMLALMNANDIRLHMFPGNHDKTVYASYDSFLDIYTHHPGVNLNRELQIIELGGLSITLLPFFSDDMLIPMLKEAKGTDVLISHFEMMGSSNLGNVSKKTSINEKLLSKWKKVYLGHYHNHQEITKDITHLPSFRQENFGEDNKKGFAILYDDCSYELIKGQFKEYTKQTIDLGKTSSKEIKDILSKLSELDSNIRLEFKGTEEQCKAIDKSQFKGLGIDIKFKYNEVFESSIEQPKAIIEKYSKAQILDSFKEFCEEKELDFKEGSVMVNEFLNR